MIKAIIFDMDGVLIDAKEWHYEALNKALGLFGYEINRYFHLTVYDGLPTLKKLEMFSREHNLPRELHGFINEMKQIYTMQIVNHSCKPRFIHEYALAQLKADGYRLAVASNSVRNTLVTMMERAFLSPYFELMLSNEDVEQPKPHPEIYQRAIQSFGVAPTECLVVEDNDNGIRSAQSAGAHVMVVNGVDEVTLDNIRNQIGAAERATLCAS